MSVTNRLAQAVTCHAWNKAGDMIALSPNNNEVHIYKTNGENTSQWQLKYVLDEHGGQVSGIDWAPESNMLLTCGHDRNAYVWKFDEKTDDWLPTLVILRINRAATCVKWSPDGNKFAVGSGAHCVPICRFEESNNWWISKTIKRHKSTVLSVAWCPNNKFIVTGCADNKCRIFSAYIEGLDSAEDDGFGALWPQQHEFGECLAEFDHARAWVNSVAWSPNGFRIAFTGHGSTAHFVQLLAGAPAKVQTVQHKGLPFMDMAFMNDDSVVAAGWECNPVLFTATGDAASPEWAFKDYVDKGEDKKADKKGPSKFGAALGVFQDATKKGISISAESKGAAETVLTTVHQNTITSVQIYAKKGTITTTGIDGQVQFWDLTKLGVSV